MRGSCPTRLLGLAALSLLVAWSTPVAGAAAYRPAPPAARRPDNRSCYVVRVSANTTDSQLERLYNETIGTEGSVWYFVYRGFHKCLGDAAGLAALLRSAAVEDIQEAKLLTLAAVQVLPATTPDLWHLDRIDQRPRVLDGRYEYAKTGSGVTIYVVDSAVRRSHEELAGRVAAGWGSGFSGAGSSNDTDPRCYTHGTHVAGVAAGTTTGAAKQAVVVPVTVMNCTAGAVSNAVLLDALEWVAQQPVGVVTLALQGPGAVDSPENVAVQRLVELGFVVVAAAGNTASDACESNPGNSPFAITVGSTDSLDRPGNTSNTGRCIDLWAPGVAVTSASGESDTALVTMSGTSVAAALVAGVVATLREEFPNHTAAELQAVLTGQATPGVLVDASNNTVDLVLYIGRHQCEPNVNTSGCQPLQLVVRGDTRASDMGWSVAEACPYRRWGPGTLADGAGGPQLHSFSLCLAPGNYTFAAEDLSGDGWTTGWFSVLLPGTSEELLAPTGVAGYGVRASFAVAEGPNPTPTATPLPDEADDHPPTWLWAMWIPIGAFVVVVVAALLRREIAQGDCTLLPGRYSWRRHSQVHTELSQGREEVYRKAEEDS